MMVAEAQRFVTALDLSPRRATWRVIESSESSPKRSSPIARVLLVFEFATLNGGERSIEAVLPQFVGTDFEFVALAPPRGAWRTCCSDWRSRRSV